jgi:hypothetical protein
LGLAISAILVDELAEKHIRSTVSRLHTLLFSAVFPAGLGSLFAGPLLYAW